MRTSLLDTPAFPARRTPIAEAQRPRTDVDKRLVSLMAPASFEAEQYRALRYQVEQLRRSRGLSVIAVTSAAYGDGKTVTAINLAGALAQAPGTRVLLAELDLRRPSLARRLAASEHGLVEAVLDPARALDDAVQWLPWFNLSVLPAGRPLAVPYEVLTAPRLGELLSAARRGYDYVVLDAVPLTSVPDTRLVATWVDGFLIVILADRTPRTLVEAALNHVERDKLIGLVFNGDTTPPLRRSSEPARRHGHHPPGERDGGGEADGG